MAADGFQQEAVVSHGLRAGDRARPPVALRTCCFGHGDKRPAGPPAPSPAERSLPPGSAPCCSPPCPPLCQGRVFPEDFQAQRLPELGEGGERGSALSWRRRSPCCCPVAGHPTLSIPWLGPRWVPVARCPQLGAPGVSHHQMGSRDRLGTSKPRCRPALADWSLVGRSQPGTQGPRYRHCQPQAHPGGPAMGSIPSLLLLPPDPLASSLNLI